MKRRKVFLVVGAVAVFTLTATLGTYSAWASPKWGFTYRVGNWGGFKIETNSGFGGELLLNYSYSTMNSEELGLHGKETTIAFNPALTYHFGESSTTSPYIGLGYHCLRQEEELKNYFKNTQTYEESGWILMAGIEHFFSKGFSCDLRITANLGRWKETLKETGNGYEIVQKLDGDYHAVDVDFGVSISF